jgi:hypothetical protein
VKNIENDYVSRSIKSCVVDWIGVDGAGVEQPAKRLKAFQRQQQQQEWDTQIDMKRNGERSGGN